VEGVDKDEDGGKEEEFSVEGNKEAGVGLSRTVGGGVV